MVDKFVDNIVSPLFALIGMSLLFGIVVLYLFQEKKPLIEKHAHYNIPTDVKPDITQILGEKVINILAGSNDPTSAAVKAFIEVDSEAVCGDLRNNKIGEMYKAIMSEIPGIVKRWDFCNTKNDPIVKPKNIKYIDQLFEIENLNFKKNCCLDEIIDEEKILIEGKVVLDSANMRKYDSKELYIMYLSSLIKFKWLYRKEMKMNLKYLSLTDAKANLVDKVMKTELEYFQNLDVNDIVFSGNQTNESIKEGTIHYMETEIGKNANIMNNIAKNLNLLKNIYNQETDSISKLLAKANDYLCFCISEDEKTDLIRPILDLSMAFIDMPKTFKSN
ncbi:hypothetical protein NERG_00581 [Nematocida ausubeli]|uniref:Uncharacterized protein n=1 Tax=Nematocida ausubeli (strain ATCC PRA-371 / ERTm2) TaxID=1913371 RepID=H8ZAG0_NEMA1|nr:hypothetical protein NERG_00581 [Nematocida ausubeli]